MADVLSVIGWIAWIAAVGRLLSLFSIFNHDTVVFLDERTKSSYGLYMLFLLGMVVITNGFLFFDESKLHILWLWPLASVLLHVSQRYNIWD